MTKRGPFQPELHHDCNLRIAGFKWELYWEEELEHCSVVLVVCLLDVIAPMQQNSQT